MTDEPKHAPAKPPSPAIRPLAAMLADPACDGLFANDGIHFGEYEREDELAGQTPDQPGLQRVAAELDSAIRTVIKSPEWAANEVHRRASTTSANSSNIPATLKGEVTR